MNYELVSDLTLRKIYTKVDRLVDKLKYELDIDLPEKEITSIDQLHLLNEKDPNLNLKNTVKYYLYKNLDLYRIFLLLLFSPQGLTKFDITLYLKADCYRDLSVDEQLSKIKKNENYTEKSIAALSAILNLFFPQKRCDYGIVLIKEQTKAGAFRYFFRKHLR